MLSLMCSVCVGLIEQPEGYSDGRDLLVLDGALFSSCMSKRALAMVSAFMPDEAMYLDRLDADSTTTLVDCISMAKPRLLRVLLIEPSPNMIGYPCCYGSISF